MRNGGKKSGKGQDLIAPDAGRRLHTIRLERGMSLAELASDDCSPARLARIETGRSRISLVNLALICSKVHMPLTNFLIDRDQAGEEAARILLDEAALLQDRLNAEESLRLLDAVPGASVSSTNLELHFLRGRALVQLGRHQDAVQELLPFLDDAGRHPDPRFRAYFAHVLAGALYSTGEFDEAAALFQSALSDALLAEPADNRLIGRIHVGHGHLHYIAGDLDQAIVSYEAAIDRFGTVRDFISQGGIYAGLQRVYLKKRDFDRCLKYALLGVGIYRSAKRAWETAVELGSVAIAYENLGRLDLADKAAREALDAATRLDDPNLVAASHGVLASICLKNGDKEGARTEAEAAIGLLEGEDRSPTRSTSFRVLAAIAEENGDWGSADSFYHQALTELAATGQGVILRDTALAYSRLLQDRGEMDEALEVALSAARSGIEARAAGL